MDAGTQEVYNAMGSTDETSLRTFASAMQALALSDPGNRLAIINWAKRIYTGRLMAMPSSGNDGINLQSVINWVAQNQDLIGMFWDKARESEAILERGVY